MSYDLAESLINVSLKFFVMLGDVLRARTHTAECLNYKLRPTEKFPSSVTDSGAREWVERHSCGDDLFVSMC